MQPDDLNHRPNHRLSDKLFLFDIDCTLLYTRGAGREAVRLAMLEVFGTVGALEGFNFGGKTDSMALRQILEQEAFTEDDFATRGDAYRESLGRHIEAVIARFDVQPLPGAHAVIARLREMGAMLGLVTGNVNTAAAIKLRAAGFDPDGFPVSAFGHEAVSRDDLPPLAIARAVEHYRRAILPHDVVIIGDTPMDIACARAVGAIAVAVDTGFEGRDALLAAQPDVLLDDLTQFNRVFDYLALNPTPADETTGINAPLSA